MWKILPFCLVVFAMGCIGVILRRDLCRRRRELGNFLLGLRIMETEMRYKASSLEKCFACAASGTEGEMKRVFQNTAERLRSGAVTADPFRECLDETADCLSLTEEDRRCFGGFCERLGTADMKSTLKDLRCTLARCEKAYAEAERNEQKWGGVFLKGGWLCGIAVALFFL